MCNKNTLNTLPQHIIRQYCHFFVFSPCLVFEPLSKSFQPHFMFFVSLIVAFATWFWFKIYILLLNLLFHVAGPLTIRSHLTKLKISVWPLNIFACKGCWNPCRYISDHIMLWVFLWIRSYWILVYLLFLFFISMLVCAQQALDFIAQAVPSEVFVAFYMTYSLS